MITKVYNKDNLREDEIDEVVTRVKVFLLNSNNEVLVALSDGGCQLPGGHKEDGETLVDTVVREIAEETGIVLDKNEIGESFYCIKHMSRNHRCLGRNRCSEIMYFCVKTNKEPRLNNLHLTDHEKENNFTIQHVKLKDLEDFINGYITPSQKEIQVIIAEELLLAVKEFKAYLNGNN